MGLFNKIEWSKCPYCNIQINSLSCYNADLVLNGSFEFQIMKCPKAECNKDFLIKRRVIMTFETEKYEE
jgi:hypothetical protein